MIQLVLIAHNLRSAHNIGSLLRTAEGLGVAKVWMSGYTPYPHHKTDERLPHLIRKLDKQITKTALGAEALVEWQHEPSINETLSDLKKLDFVIAALEQAPGSIKLPDFKPPSKLALIVGNEVKGLDPEILTVCDYALEVPMFGQKESFNVVQAAAMALYHCRFLT